MSRRGWDIQLAAASDPKAAKLHAELSSRGSSGVVEHAFRMGSQLLRQSNHYRIHRVESRGSQNLFGTCATVVGHIDRLRLTTAPAMLLAGNLPVLSGLVVTAGTFDRWPWGVVVAMTARLLGLTSDTRF
jgi:hypothetical protein